MAVRWEPPDGKRKETMTFEEFKKEVEQDLLGWISRTERKPSAWFASVEEWAARRFNESYKKDFPNG